MDNTIYFKNPFDYQIDFSKITPIKYLHSAKPSLSDLEKIDDTTNQIETQYDEYDFAFQCSIFARKPILDYAFKNHGIRYTVREDGSVGIEPSKKKDSRKFYPQNIHIGATEAPMYPIPVCIDPDLEKTIEEIIVDFSDKFTALELDIIKKLLDLFTPSETVHAYSTRLIWPYNSIVCFFPVQHEELVLKLLPAVSYSINSGGWRRSAIRLGYLPIQDARSRL